MFTKGFQKTSSQKYVWLYHGTTASALESIKKSGMDPKYHGSGLGAPDLLNGKKVMSYTKNKNVGKMYARPDSIVDVLLGRNKQEPILVKVPVDKKTYKEVTSNNIHHEVHSSVKIPTKDIVFPGTEEYKKIEMQLSKVASTASIVPKSLGALTGAPAMKTFGRPVRKFAKPGRQAIVGLSRLSDGLR